MSSKKAKEALLLVKQFIQFGIVGLSNTLISLVVYYLFIIINEHWYLAGNAVGFMVSTVNAYYWNSRKVFKTAGGGREPTRIRILVKTFAAYGLSLALSTVLSFILVDKARISVYVAPCFVLMITVPLNFCMNKYWVYSKREQKNGT